MSSPSAKRPWIPLLLGFLLASRFALLVLAPHTDPSESRYAEIARKMAETGDWITPQFDYGIPFWAKPPLSIWMSAAGIELFGANEFGSRIFIFLGSLVVLAMVADSARREFGGKSGWTAALILTGMPLFFFCSAAVMTDAALLLGTTLSMLCFRDAMLGGSRVKGLGVFLGFAIGLLAKGPLALVIAIPPMLCWTVLTGRWRQAWHRLPWFSGTLLMLALSLPWYLAAEQKTPGFLEYFLIGEHWKRFTVRGWQGDLYGNAHPVYPGMIWVYLVLGSFPWCLPLLRTFPAPWQTFKRWSLEHDARGLYWILWAIWPVLFFTPARNIIATYPLPALPALALLLTGLACTRNASRPIHPAIAVGSMALVSWALVVGIFLPNLSPKQSERELVRLFEQEHVPGEILVYYGPRKYSAEFYTAGGVRHTASATELEGLLEAPGRCFVALPSYWMPMVPPRIQRRLQPVLTRPDGPSLYVKRMDAPELGRIDLSKTLPIGN